jgi:hypothetical protein
LAQNGFLLRGLQVRILLGSPTFDPKNPSNSNVIVQSRPRVLSTERMLDKAGP